MTANRPVSTTSLPVSWFEAVPRAESIPEYVSVAALPGAISTLLDLDPQLERALSQFLLLSRRSRKHHATNHGRLVGALLVKLLQRGRTPLATLSIEREALRMHGFLDDSIDLSVEGTEVGWFLNSPHVSGSTADGILARLADRDTFGLDGLFNIASGPHSSLIGSSSEQWFIDRWVPTTLGSFAGHWFTPQAPLDQLLEAAGVGEQGSRRVDFLFSHPGGPPFAIEVDGPEHVSSARVDSLRDESLDTIGIDVLRVGNDEVIAGSGAVLDQIRERCESAFEAVDPALAVDPASLLVTDCSDAAKVQYAIARAIGHGWLHASQDWEIDLTGVGSVSGVGVLDILRLLSSFDLLYDGQSTPGRCTVRADDGFVVTWIINNVGQWVDAPGDVTEGERLRIAVESRSSPFDRMGDFGPADFKIRPAFLPVDFATENTFDLGRLSIAPNTFADARDALTTILQTVFRKYAFRPNQGEAVFNALRQNDSVVLLPTGLGKSIIYQLAGLLMPGITLVVAPLVSLIEDQVDGLRRYGIDRAAPIASNLGSPEERRQLLLRVERGEYHFVLLSPERLQSPQFRGSLRALVQSSLVNLAVIDEAHCVSDWGHDFRPAYLNLAQNLRRLGADSNAQPPPLLALTGTASRAVLRDMLTSFEIDRSRPDALIRPDTFDRAELSFEIVRTSPAEDTDAALRGLMNSLPGKFGLPRAEFYRPSGRDTSSGVVFVPTVNARGHGLIDTLNTVRAATNTDVTIYSGSPPRGTNRATYEIQKRENASAFKANLTPILVATKAFGMGIDKPNIRYTVHYGIPNSVENLYQEAGRAGRDRNPALCMVVFSEFSPARSDELLDPDLDLETLRSRFVAIDRDRRTGDDVTRALWFHLEAFQGVTSEVADVEDVLFELGDISAPRRVEVPFSRDAGRVNREKAICRLVKLGVIVDYEVDFGARRFIVIVDSFDLDHSKGRLLGYVNAAQPARSRVIARQLESIGSGNPLDVAAVLSQALIEFTYDVIERSRRRMIQESILLARQARNDAEIRNRILDYLQEGLGAANLEELIEAPDINLQAWLELTYRIQTPIDAGEVRGLCIRALESYPDHPGLLLTRAVAESMCSDHDQRVTARGVSSAVRRAVVEYEIPIDEVSGIVNDLFDLAFTRAQSLRTPLVYAMFELADGYPDLQPVAELGLSRATEYEDDPVRVILATRRATVLIGQLNELVERSVTRYRSPSVKRLLTGV